MLWFTLVWVHWRVASHGIEAFDGPHGVIGARANRGGGCEVGEVGECQAPRKEETHGERLTCGGKAW